ncbi:FAD-dependent oxidoreductase [Streptomyces sp. MMBL 11-3]|uniref:FAD-dependent oxidoreductase n=1 Tax=Streptomyces sp. MMBL 11-3 TaxID=3382639 RepID=UPI0039B606DA
MHPIRTQVVVVGGGPVGMLVAAELAAYGVGVVVLEREAATSQRPKATTVHARTVQTLARRGYLPAPSRGAGTVRSGVPLRRPAGTGHHRARERNPRRCSNAPRPTWRACSSGGPARAGCACCASTA